MLTYHIKITNIFIDASAKHVQKSIKGLPFGPMRLSMIPIRTENTTRPSTFIELVPDSPGSHIDFEYSVNRSIRYEPQLAKTYLLRRAATEDSNLPVHSCNLIRVFTMRMKKLWILGFLKCAQWRLWSGCANAQAILIFIGRTSSNVRFLVLCLLDFYSGSIPCTNHS